MSAGNGSGGDCPDRARIADAYSTKHRPDKQGRPAWSSSRGLAWRGPFYVHDSRYSPSRRAHWGYKLQHRCVRMDLVYNAYRSLTWTTNPYNTSIYMASSVQTTINSPHNHY